LRAEVGVILKRSRTGSAKILLGVGIGVRRATLVPEMHEPQASGGERWKEGWQIPAVGGVACPQGSAKAATRSDPLTPTPKGTTHGSSKKSKKVAYKSHRFELLDVRRARLDFFFFFFF